MFTVQGLKTAIAQDNPTYERIKTSDLHALVAKLTSGRFSATEIATEMRKVTNDKWKKYGTTRRYLLNEIPGLAAQMSMGLVNFRTTNLQALPGGNIIHEATWDCGTGIKDDLKDWHVREKVMWDNAAPEATNYLDGAYRVAGQHTGVGNAVTSAGNVMNMSDTHDAKGAWSHTIVSFAGPGAISYRCTQVYQYSDDNKLSWKDIPNSTYEIIRTASTVDGKLKLEILKRSIPPNAKQESQTNFTTL
jgi:hypothetical protein